MENEHYVDISKEQRRTFSPAEPSDPDRERMSAMSSQSSPSESYRSEYLGLTGEDTHERRTINPQSISANRVSGRCARPHAERKFWLLPRPLITLVTLSSRHNFIFCRMIMNEVAFF